MAGATIYLDVDDEITSAAARIRGVEGTRVAMVLPHGSRVATSRINFRLLARDAQEHLKRLSIVASDPATRALAASAGLPVFASVGEYEDALRDGAAQRGADAEADPGDAEVGPLGVAGAAGAAAAGLGSAGAASATDTGSLTIERSSPSVDPRAAAVGTAVGAAAAAGTPGPSTRGPVTAAGAPPGAARTRSSQPTAVAAADLPPAPVDARPGQMLSGDGRRGIGRGLAIGGLAILLLAVVVGGVSAYLLLPSATATVAARQEPTAPLTMPIPAAPDATSPDVTRGVVPAQRITVPVEASDTFPATGKRVELKAATGSVRFQNLDPTSQNTIGKGSIVSTPSG